MTRHRRSASRNARRSRSISYLRGGRRCCLETLEQRQVLSGFTVADQVWNDLNANGLQDQGDVVLPGVAVELYGSTDQTLGNADDGLLAMTVSDANGQYAFSGLPDNLNYYMVFRAPVGFQFTTQDVGADDTLDSDVDATGLTALFSGVAGQTYTSQDAGLVGAAPTFGFALGVGGAGVDAATTLQADSSGDVYLVGGFSGAADFDFGPGQYVLAPAGGHDIFIARYTATGALRWARSVGGSGGDLANCAALASDGNLYLTGYFSGTADFDPSVGTANLTSAGGSDVFVAKFDGAGGLLWVARAGGTGDDVGRGIAMAADGSIYTTGYYAGTVDFDPSPTVNNLTTGGTFVWKLDAAGGLLWAKGFDANGAHTGVDVAVAADGSVYAAGTCAASIDLDPGAGSVVFTSAGGDDAFLVKLSASGDFQWGQGVGGTAADEAFAVATSSDGRVYLAGVFSGTADFDAGASLATLTSAGNSADGFVACYNSFGVVQWAQPIGGSGVDYVQDLVVGADRNVYAVGLFQSTVDFDPGAGVYSRQSAGGTDVFVVKFDSGGNLGWARTFGGTNDDLGFGIVATADGSVDVAGQFSGTVDFDPGAGVFPISSSDAAAFLVRLYPPLPSDVWFTPDRVLAGQPAGTLVGHLWAVEDAVHDSFDFALVDGAGSNDNAAFAIVGRELRTAAALNAAHGAYHLRVRVVNGLGYYREQALTVTAVDPAQACTISGRVWDDLNRDGTRNAGEMGLANVPVRLVVSADATAGNYDDFVSAVVMSDAQGQFQFDRLVPGLNYYYTVCAPVGYTFSPQQVGSDSNLDSDVSATGLLPLVALSTGPIVIHRDVGLVGAAPDFGWALHAAGAANEQARGVAVDAAGNVYATGFFQGTVDFDPGPGYYQLTAVGDVDAYVAKYTAGGALAWIEQIGGSGSTQGNALALAPDGSLYLTGRFAGQIDVDPGASVALLTSGGSYDLFTLKLDAAGQLVWGKQTTSSGDDTGMSVAVAADGSVYTAGSANGDIALIKQNAAGDFLWTQHFGGTGADAATGVAVAADGSVYIVGAFTGTVDFDPGAATHELTSQGNNDVFLCKFNADGNYQWSRSAGGADFDAAFGLALAPDGKVYVAGGFAGTVDFDPGAATLPLTATGTTGDAFVWKLTATGDAVWAQSFGAGGDDEVRSLAVGADGTLYATGYFQESVDFDPGTASTTLTSAGGADVFLAEFSPQGTLRNARRMGGASEDGALAVCRGADGGVYLAGTFTGAADFDPGVGDFTLTSAGANDLFLAKLRSFAKSACGVYDPMESKFYLKFANSEGVADLMFGFGAPGWKPLAGDWDGDGRDTIGLFQPEAAHFYLRNSNDSGTADLDFGYGDPRQGDQYVMVMGDWNGDGVDTIGLYHKPSATWFLRNTNTEGVADVAFGFGVPGSDWTPMVGDWNGDGVDTIGLYDPATGMFYLRNTQTTGVADIAFPYGAIGGGWTPLIGDWNGDGAESAGFYQPGAASHFYLRNEFTAGVADVNFGLGFAGVQPIVGNWLGTTGQGLHAAGEAAAVAPSSLNSQALIPLITEAIARWAATGISPQLLDTMARAQVMVVDLPDAGLGQVDGGRIYLDRDAAGHGWFVDPTPECDEEFVACGGQLQAVDPRALDRIDLLTVVEHELGHLAGLDDLPVNGSALMAGRLADGLRRVPDSTAGGSAAPAGTNRRSF